MLFEFKKLDKRERKALLLFTIVFILFYVLRIFTNASIFPDSVEYFQTAESIKTGLFFQKQPSVDASVFITKRPFLYPLFLLLLSGLSLNIILFIQTLFGLFNLYLMLQLNKRINGVFSNSIYLFVLLTPSIFIYAQLVMTEWLVMTLLMLLALLLTAEWSTKRFWVIQVITVLLAFTKPVFYPFIYLNFIFFAIYFIRIKKFSIALFLPVVCLFGYMKFNEYRTGDLHFSSIQNTNLIDYNIYLFKSRYDGNDSADAWIKNVHAHTQKVKTFRELNAYYHSTATAEIKEHIFKYSFYHFYTALRGTLDPGRFNLMTFVHKDDGAHGFLHLLNRHNAWKSFFQSKYIFLYLLLIPCFIAQVLKTGLGIAYVLMNRKKIKPLYFYLLMLIVYYTFITGPVNASRYMMPVQGIIIVFAVWSLRNIPFLNFKKSIYAR